MEAAGIEPAQDAHYSRAKGRARQGLSAVFRSSSEAFRRLGLVVIDPRTQALIVASVADLWREQRTDPTFIDAFQGKERGHRIADYVEAVTVEKLEGSFDVKHEVSNGQRRARGMGDLWLLSSGIYNPINVKAGVLGVGGQPNLVSLAKLTSAMLDHIVDCYYLLFVKFTDAAPPEVDVELINLLDYLDYVHFDSGTGQMMLRADRFLNRPKDTEPVPTDLTTAIARLLEMRRRGNESLARIRATKLAALEERALTFDSAVGIDQSGLELG